MLVIGCVHHIFAWALGGVATCEYPIYLAPEMVADLAQMHHVAVFRRLGHRGRTLDLPPNLAQDCHRAVLRDINSDYQRNLRQWVAPQAGDDEEMKLSEGADLPPPGVDEIVPDWPKSRHPRLCSKVAGSAGSDAPGDSMTFPSVQAPKRTRAAEEGEECAKRQ